jgi:hypothetical protein
MAADDNGGGGDDFAEADEKTDRRMRSVLVTSCLVVFAVAVAAIVL